MSMAINSQYTQRTDIQNVFFRPAWVYLQIYIYIYIYITVFWETKINILLSCYFTAVNFTIDPRWPACYQIKMRYTFILSGFQASALNPQDLWGYQKNCLMHPLHHNMAGYCCPAQVRRDSESDDSYMWIVNLFPTVFFRRIIMGYLLIIKGRSTLKVN